MLVQASSQRASFLAVLKGANFEKRDHNNNMLPARTNILLHVKWQNLTNPPTLHRKARGCSEG